MGRAQPQRRRAYAHHSTPPAPHLKAVPPLEQDGRLSGTPQAQPAPAQGILYGRHPIEFLRRAVRRSTADEFLGWSRGAVTKEITDIIGITTDRFVIYSDGVGLAAQRLDAFAEYAVSLTEQALAAGKRYDPLVVEFIRYGGILPPKPGDGCC